MSKLIATLCLLAVALATVVPHVGPVESHKPLTYKVNLEDDPKTRWGPIILDFKEPLTRFIDFVDLLPIPKGFFDGVEWYAKNEFKYPDFVAEADAIAELSGLPFDKIFFLNFFYEFSTFKACTGILVRNDEGKVLHGRNLDFEMWELLAKLLTNIEYYKGGKLLYSVDTVVGSAFALTGIRHGAFAINVDTRKAKDFSQDLISILKDNAIPTVWLLRKTLEEQTTYAAAVQRLKTERIGGPVYYVISGVGANEGMVIERDVDAVHAYYELSETNWFLIQTNYDRDQPDPLHDPRRIPVEKKMAERGNKGLTEKQLLEQFMMEWPTFNIASIMSTIMVPSSGYHNTTVWYGYNPVPHQETIAEQ
jgi:hypothetical protein